MKIIAKRFIDEFRPGAEIPVGRYDGATLKRLIEKGHVARVEEPAPPPAKPAVKKQD